MGPVRKLFHSTSYCMETGKNTGEMKTYRRTENGTAGKEISTV
jgi:hypothetical protein